MISRDMSVELTGAHKKVKVGAKLSIKSGSKWFSANQIAKFS